MTNLAIAQSAVASWAVPTVAAARAKRYAAALKIDGVVTEFPSVPKALASIGVSAGNRTIRAMARDAGYVELPYEVDGHPVLLAVLRKS